MKVFRLGLMISFLFASATANASLLKLKVQHNELRINGEFTFNQQKPFVIEGMDDAGKPYKFTFQTEKTSSKDDQVLRFIFVMDRAGKLESSAVVQQKGQWAQIKSTTDSKPPQILSFEALLEK